MLRVLIGLYFNHSHWSVSSLTEHIPSLSLSLSHCPATLVHPLIHSLWFDTCTGRDAHPPTHLLTLVIRSFISSLSGLPACLSLPSLQLASTPSFHTQPCGILSFTASYPPSLPLPPNLSLPLSLIRVERESHRAAPFPRLQSDLQSVQQRPAACRHRCMLGSLKSSVSLPDTCSFIIFGCWTM